MHFSIQVSWLAGLDLTALSVQQGNTVPKKTV